LAASVNHLRGQIIPNAVLAPVSADGEVCFYSLAETHVVVDLNGWFAVREGFGAVSPVRCSTRVPENRRVQCRW
jgi:hypothetical protein